jgi:hypothetical protein
MGRRVAHLFGAALLVLAVGCRSKPLQELDGGTGVIGAWTRRSTRSGRGR